MDAGTSQSGQMSAALEAGAGDELAAAPLNTKQAFGPIVFAADAAFAAPLATALRSLAESNMQAWPLDIHVLSEGMDEATKQRIAGSMPENSAAIKWHSIETLSFASQFATRPGVSKMTFARLLLPRFLPATCDRALYLDADVLVLDTLEPLWDLNLDGAVIAAVPDYCLDRAAAKSSPAPETSLSVERYFNAGMIFLDFEKWRSERISERALEYLDHFPTTEYADQDALNFVCDGRWKELQQTWNFQFDPSQVIARTLREQNLKIVHFVTNVKPWRSGSLSPNVGFYDAFRSRTRFALTHRERLSSALKRVCSRLVARSALLTSMKSRVRSIGQRRSFRALKVNRGFDHG
ncbi:glycosyltransferase family 8 protein [Aliirhizobium smilacinae]|nr:glycosyltransferase family 8 protein [Rhizobium smilacinae]